MKRFALSFFIVMSLVWMMGCTETTVLVVVNQGDQSLSQIDLESGAVADLCPEVRLGTVPNAIVVDETKAYITNSGSDSLQIIDLETCALVASIELPKTPVRCNPWATAVITQVDPAGNEVKKAYTTCFLSSTVQVIDLQENQIVAEIPLAGPDQFHPASPTGITLFGDHAFVANTGLDTDNGTYGNGTVTVLDIKTDSVIDTDNNSGNGNETPIQVGQKNPGDLAVDSGGTLFSACTGTFTQLQQGLIDSTNSSNYTSIQKYNTGGSPVSVAIANNGKGFAGDGVAGKVYVFDTFSRQVLRGSQNPVVVTTTPGDFIPDIIPHNDFVYAISFETDKVYQISSGTDAIVTNYMVDNHPIAGAVYTFAASPGL